MLQEAVAKSRKKNSVIRFLITIILGLLFYRFLYSFFKQISCHGTTAACLKRPAGKGKPEPAPAHPTGTAAEVRSVQILFSPALPWPCSRHCPPRFPRPPSGPSAGPPCCIPASCAAATGRSIPAAAPRSHGPPLRRAGPFRRPAPASP